MLGHAAQHLRRLQPRHPQHTRRSRAHARHPCADVVRQAAVHVPRDQHAFHRARPQRVRRHAAVAQARNQHRARMLRQHLPDGLRQLPAERLAHAQLDGHRLRAAERHIGAPRPAELPGRLLVLNPDHRALDAAFKPHVADRHAAARLHRQVRPLCSHASLRGCSWFYSLPECRQKYPDFRIPLSRPAISSRKKFHFFEKKACILSSLVIYYSSLRGEGFKTKDLHH